MRRVVAVVSACSAVLLGAVAVADLLSKGASSIALAGFPAQGRLVKNGYMLYDGALSPTYTEGEDPVNEYQWSGVHSQGYDPEFQNAFKDLPMNNVDIKAAEPDREFWGQAPHSMELSCDKTGGCAPEVNVFDEMPTTEAKTLSNRMPQTFPVESQVFDNMPLDY